jgi:hypothetical protein
MSESDALRNRRWVLGVWAGMGLAAVVAGLVSVWQHRCGSDLFIADCPMSKAMLGNHLVISWIAATGAAAVIRWIFTTRLLPPGWDLLITGIPFLTITAVSILGILVPEPFVVVYSLSLLLSTFLPDWLSPLGAFFFGRRFPPVASLVRGSVQWSHDYRLCSA